MSKSGYRVGLVAICFAALGSGACFGEVRCPGMRLFEVNTLAALPKAFRQSLPPTSGHDGLADRDGRFNVTDALTPATADLPMKRFLFAAVGATCSVMAVEIGGIAHHFEAWEYRVIQGTWRKVSSEDLPWRKPNSISDLLNRWRLSHDPLGADPDLVTSVLREILAIE
jgi:hypothetical protein